MIGDLESQEKGSAARACEGKAQWSFMPLTQIAMLMKSQHTSPTEPTELAELVNQLGWFQGTGEFKDAFRFLKSAYEYLMFETGTNFDEASKQVIRVWELGEQKYARFNWMKGMPWSQVINSAQRHIMALYNGEQIDADSGEHHGAHIICNAMMLVHFVEHYQDGNDLPVDWYT